MRAVVNFFRSYGVYLLLLLVSPLILVCLACGYLLLAVVYAACPPVSQAHSPKWHPLRALSAPTCLWQQLSVAARLGGRVISASMRRNKAPASIMLRDLPYRDDVDECKMDLYFPPGFQHEARPWTQRVLVFVNGFGFKQGSVEGYFDVAQKLSSEFGAVVAVPNTRGYPSTSDVDDMVDDVGAALMKLASLASSNFELVAHSSGCSLVMVGLLRAHSEGGDAGERRGWRNLEGFRRIGSVVCLAGVFDISAHYRHEWRRGVESVSALGVVHSVTKAEAKRTVSASALAEALPTSVAAKLPPLLLLHGDLDDVAPETHSVSFARCLQTKGAAATCVVLHGVDHYDVCWSIGASALGNSICSRLHDFFGSK
eukprot:TRINITY_DN46043_c0_g1_i1.p1 TRINITY_DN46043_c0_g1~~TRINITY_DN46043_c0_g1_i1.p1  ORF type:complete len:370 (-),score=57.80 TRINITY_DN46043_c0_g1_i1:81-1190(-)